MTDCCLTVTLNHGCADAQKSRITDEESWLKY
jgi:hypothetical protein